MLTRIRYLPIALLLLSDPSQAAICMGGTRLYEGTVSTAGPDGKLFNAPITACFSKGNVCDVTGNDFRIVNRSKVLVEWASSQMGVTVTRKLAPGEEGGAPLPDKYCAAPTCFKNRSYEVKVYVHDCD